MDGFMNPSLTRMPRRLIIVMAFGLGLFSIAQARQQARLDLRKQRSAGPDGAVATLPVIQAQQGYKMHLWLGSNGTVGGGAFTDFNPPDQIGCEYPVSSLLEHLYGAGIWVGATVDTARSGFPQPVPLVTTAYDWGLQGPRHEMYGHQTERDTFFRTSIYNTNEPNRRGVDDDQDGRIDEDELDGYDNDGDWTLLADDLGADGLPDSLETGCKGPYDALNNPDPAFDNYAPSKFDPCHRDANGFPTRMSNKVAYTQNNGIVDHGEPHVDEDYGAVSESDIYISYTDLFQNPTTAGHYPLGLNVFQKSYAWRNFIKEPFVIQQYTIANVGARTLDSVFIGFFVDPLVGPILQPDITNHKYVAYLPNLRTGYAHNAIDRPSTPIGVTVLGTPRALEDLRYTFSWNRFQDNPGTDADHYATMASGLIKPDQPITSGEDTQFLFAFGPFRTMFPGDTLSVTVALVSGDGVEVGESPLKENAARALGLFNNGYRLAAVPPSPPLRFTKGPGRVKLDWKWQPGDPYTDPLETWDDSDRFVGSLPVSDWRRINPPTGHVTGGRIFEGFRIWRSESPVFVPDSYTLLKQFDVDDSQHFEYATGIKYEYVDSGLNVGKTYRYAVTSFSIPRITYVVLPDPLGGPARLDTLISPPVESDVSQNDTRVQLPFAPSTRSGDVKVVPNPYRTDQNYTFEEGGWEGRTLTWDESKRIIWFTHLPARAVIRIFSLSGDIVATLTHDDAGRVAVNKADGQEEWNLLSDSGRAIASGVYIFTVESEFGKQVGKFAIIR